MKNLRSPDFTNTDSAMAYSHGPSLARHTRSHSYPGQQQRIERERPQRNTQSGSHSRQHQSQSISHEASNIPTSYPKQEQLRSFQYQKEAIQPSQTQVPYQPAGFRKRAPPPVNTILPYYHPSPLPSPPLSSKFYKDLPETLRIGNADIQFLVYQKPAVTPIKDTDCPPSPVEPAVSPYPPKQKPSTITYLPWRPGASVSLQNLPTPPGSQTPSPSGSFHTATPIIKIGTCDEADDDDDKSICSDIEYHPKQKPSTIIYLPWRPGASVSLQNLPTPPGSQTPSPLGSFHTATPIIKTNVRDEADDDDGKSVCSDIEYHPKQKPRTIIYLPWRPGASVSLQNLPTPPGSQTPSPLGSLHTATPIIKTNTRDEADDNDDKSIYSDIEGDRDDGASFQTPMTPYKKSGRTMFSPVIPTDKDLEDDKDVKTPLADSHDSTAIIKIPWTLPIEDTGMEDLIQAEIDAIDMQQEARPTNEDIKLVAMVKKTLTFKRSWYNDRDEEEEENKYTDEYDEVVKVYGVIRNGTVVK